MIILALDTSTAQAQLALYDAASDRTLYALSWLSRQQQTRELAVHIDTALGACDLTPAQVGMVATATGPGSFTGVRISLSVAKGMALGAQGVVVLVGVPTMAIMLASLYYQKRALARTDTLMALLPAGRGSFIWTAMTAWTPHCDPRPDDYHLGKVTALVGFLERSIAEGKSIWIGGELTPEVQAAIQHLPGVVVQPRAYACSARAPTVLARLAWERWQTDPGCADPEHLVPLYVSSS